jgi:nitrate reductase NapD
MTASPRVDEVHIASLVVHTTPARLARVAESIAAVASARVHATAANGKLVVTLEAPTTADMSERVNQIQRIDGVLSATLVYQCADTLDAMNQEMTDEHAQARIS